MERVMASGSITTRVFFRSHPVDEEVIIAAGNVIDRREAPVAEEQPFLYERFLPTPMYGIPASA